MVGSRHPSAACRPSQPPWVGSPVTSSSSGLVAYSAVAVSPALITQRLIDRDLAAGDVSLVVALALLLVLASGAQSALSVLLVRLLSAMGEGVAADVSILLIVLSKITQYNEQNYSVPCGGAVCTSALR